MFEGSCTTCSGMKSLSVYEILLCLKHKGTVCEYREQFEIYAGLMCIIEHTYLKRIFLREKNISTMLAL